MYRILFFEPLPFRVGRRMVWTRRDRVRIILDHTARRLLRHG